MLTYDDLVIIYNIAKTLGYTAVLEPEESSKPRQLLIVDKGRVAFFVPAGEGYSGHSGHKGFLEELMKAHAAVVQSLREEFSEEN